MVHNKQQNKQPKQQMLVL